MRITRRGLQLALGVLWLLDGALQLQPVMFTRVFAMDIIGPARSGQPGFVQAIVSAGVWLIGRQPASFDVIFAVVQLGLGLGMLWPRAVRVALPASIAWAAGVWVFGEGLGGLAGGQSGLLAGAPGAALLYGVLSLAAWPRGTASSGRPASWLRPAWAVLWLGAAVLQLLPGQRPGSAVASALTGNLAGVPGPLAAASRSLAGVAAGHGAAAALILAVLFAAVGMAGLLPGRWPAAAAAGGVVLAAGIWVLAQGFGAIGTGQATDPNTGPLLALFAVAMWSAVPRARSGAAALPAPADVPAAAEPVRPRSAAGSGTRAA